MRRCLPLWVMTICLSLAACVTDQSAQPYPGRSNDAPASASAAPSNSSAARGNSSSVAAKNSFLLGVGDSITISVWRFDDLKRTVLVDPAGNIQFPFAGEVTAAGLTMDQLRRELEAKLAAYYVDPKVDISVSQVRSQVVHVLGEVKNPASISMERRTTVIEAIAQAGGFTLEANEERVLLIRDREPEPQVFLLALNLRSGQTSPDRRAPLLNNDIIYVPPTQVVDFTRFLNQLVGVLNPFMAAGRSIIIADQVNRVLRGTTGGNLLVSP